ncbi:exosortase-dependent surface protein XDP2 [Cognatiyoonia sediminum]|nr:exosortase-dependent surface protein XDP2 [Cognatiyoonia sediminum]
MKFRLGGKIQLVLEHSGMCFCSAAYTFELMEGLLPSQYFRLVQVTRAAMIKPFTRAAISVVFLNVLSSIATAGPIHPMDLQVALTPGTNDSTSPYQDDVHLTEITFGDLVLSITDQIVSVADFEVLSGRSNINAEWGDLDDDADGDADPFVKAGFSGLDQETVDPTVQDATLQEAFSSFSLSEMSDGEGNSEFSFQLLFAQSLVDNAYGEDEIPELVIFERGLNDDFDIRLILGESAGEYTYSDWLQTSSKLYFDTGIRVDTVEINSSQSIGVGGYDFDMFGLPEGQAVFGMELRTTNGSGPDLNGFFLTAADPDSFGPELTPVPLPAAGWMLIVGLGSLAAMRRRKKVV